MLQPSMTLPRLLIRSGAISDSAAIGRILAEGWLQAYSGFMPKDELGPRVDPDHRVREVGRWLSSGFDTDTELLLVADQAGEVAGFLAARLGEAHEHERAHQPDPLEAVEWFKVRAPGPICIGAFEQNPFGSFYDAIGGVPAKTVRSRVDAFEWPVVVYLWPSPEALGEGVAARGA